jgi:glyceraldehyde-3-phosphate dehydrogenase (NADP+)
VRDVRQFLAGEWFESARWSPVRSPADGEQVARRREATPAQVEFALEAAASASALARRSTRRARARLLAAAAGRLSARRGELARVLVEEAGLPTALAEGETDRSIRVFEAAGEEARRLGGESIPLDGHADVPAEPSALASWIARGPVLAFAPFNSALEFVARRVAPALASGACVIVRPPPQAPSACQILAEAFVDSLAETADVDAALPGSALQILNAADEVAALAVSDPRVAVLSFAGSEKAGILLRAQAAAGKVLLDVFGESAVVVARDADLELAAARCAFGAFAFAGQAPGSVRRVFVANEVAESFKSLLLAQTAKFRVGDPTRPDVVVGPLVDDEAALAAQAWLKDAVDGGAQLKIGGRRVGRALEPAVLFASGAGAESLRREIAAPFVVVECCRDADAGLAACGLAGARRAGLFTDSASLIRRASERSGLRFLCVNDVPAYYPDFIARVAIEEYCERRIVAYRREC